MNTAGLVLAFSLLTGGALAQAAGALPVMPPAESAELAAKGDRCVLTWAGENGREELAVGIPFPCAFHREPGGAVRYHLMGSRRLALIEHSTPDPARGGCLTTIRGVAFDGEAVALSPGLEKVAACPPFRWDEKMFIGLF